jgi:adenine phosphoribosyltransferase
MTLEEKLKSTIRDVPDFPKEGIMFKDISTIMLDPELSNDIVEHLAAKYKYEAIDAVAGLESRGFLFGFPLAMKLGVPFVLIRKQGKLPKVRGCLSMTTFSQQVGLRWLPRNLLQNAGVLLPDSISWWSLIF